MADVFFSYTHSERDRLIPMVDRMKSLGLTVWFDVDIPAGSTYEDVIAQELENAKAIVVCWSKTSTKSKWVRSEASVAQDQGTIVPCFLEVCPLKPPFNITQTEDLSGWAGETTSPAWRKLIERIGKLVDRPGLVGLMDALADPTGGRLAQWVERHPDDAFVPNAKETWSERQREILSREKASASARLNDAMDRHRASIRIRFDALSEAVETWLLTRGQRTAIQRPDPDQLANELLALPLRPGESNTAADLKTALHTIDEMRRIDRDRTLTIEEQAAKLKKVGDDLEQSERDTGYLQSEIHRLKHAPTRGPGRPSRAFYIGSLCVTAVLCLAAGFGVTKLATDQRIEGLSSELSTSRSELEQLKVSSNQEIEKLQGDNDSLRHNSASATDVHKADALKAILDDEKATSPTPATPPLSPAPGIEPPPTPRNNAADVCDDNAGGLFDKDNTSKKGTADVYQLSLDSIKDTIEACSQALKKPRNGIMKRRLTAQLGRAYIALAIKQKRELSDDDTSRSEMETALQLLREAEQEGSIYAKVLLGSYYMGLPGSQLDPKFFADPDKQRAFNLYTEAADAGSPIAMTNLAALKIDPSFSRNVRLSDVEDLLRHAEAQHYPKAFEIEANTWLNPFLRAGVSVGERRKSAAALIMQEECLGYADEADKYFKENSRLTPYRLKSTCADVSQNP